MQEELGLSDKVGVIDIDAFYGTLAFGVSADEHDIVTLRFHPDSAPDIHYNIFTPGSSAGSYGGGEVANKLPRDFYVGCTIEMFAEYFHEERRATVMANETLRRFLEAANRRLKKK